jgi:branched-chain amino acid transport system substrate-binding protein
VRRTKNNGASRQERRNRAYRTRLWWAALQKTREITKARSQKRGYYAMVALSGKVRWLSYSAVICLLVLLPFTIGFAEQDKIKVGIIGPMKFVQGKQAFDGATLAVEEINAVGGVKIGGKRHKIELVKADSNEWGSITDAAGAMERLVSGEKVKLAIGGYRSEAVLAMQEIAMDNKTIYFSVGAGAPQIAERVAKDYDRFKYWFREGQPNTAVGGKSVFAGLGVVGNKMREQFGIKTPKVALLFERVMWADVTVKIAKKLLPKMGLQVAGTWRPSHAANNLRAELNAIKGSGAHIIFAGTSGPVGIALGRQWGELKIPAALVGYNGEGMKGKYWNATDGLCNYEVVADYVVPADVTERAAPFYNKFVKRFNDCPTNSALSYNAVLIWKEAVERAGTLESDAVVAEIEKTDFQGANGPIRYTSRSNKWPHDIKWGPDDLTLFCSQWRDGKKVTIWPDGRPFLGDERWKKTRFKGTVDYELPPWVLKYWKNKK